MDYSDPNSWFIAPTSGRSADAPDVFVIAPTFVFDPARPVYVDIADPEYLDGNEEFASIAVHPVFDGLDVNVWLPKYRQVNGGHLGSVPDPMTLFWDDGPQPVAQDVFDAFSFFLLNRSDAPFVIFSHSQGSILNVYLLAGLLPMLPEQTRAQLGVDYLIGWGLTDAVLNKTAYPASTSPTDTGTIVSWNTATPSEVAGKYRATWGDASTRAVNPITFDTREEYVPASKNGRSVLRYFDEKENRVQPGVTGARLVRPTASGGVFAGQVVALDLDEHSFRSESSITEQDASQLGYTHHWDISLFADSIRANLQTRLGITPAVP
ncbi:MAG: DUF3089 domain-containing protein [Propionibacteriaceae bacterium]|jgi:hypothetical protein|nr:DUF3089 domain-containing protein [Propionibacteriaceae bacterium]